MFLIDEPYVSDFLVETIRVNNFKIVATPQATQLIPDLSLNWVSEENAISILKKIPHTPLYTNSENSIAWINKHLPDSLLSNQIETFKNKVKFRELIRESFPSFFFKSIKLEAIQNLDISKIQFPFVIKPSVGFFSLGVHIIHDIKDWDLAKQELNIHNLQSTFPKEVLDTSNFIIEEYIKGEEYAIDAYFNKDGEIVILNILHHKFSSEADTSDRVYSTSKEIIYENKNRVEGFLQPIGDKLNLRNFPLHVEIRINEEGQISPIEINPLRFGGWCTTADLTGYALGINSYDFFLTAKKPNWVHIFKNRNHAKYSIIVLNNNSGIAPDKIQEFRYDLLEQDHEKVLAIRKLDIKNYPVFGFLFTETSIENEQELDDILKSDLRKYIVTNSTFILQ
jgi:hypothetical protein